MAGTAFARSRSATDQKYQRRRTSDMRDRHDLHVLGYLPKLVLAVCLPVPNQSPLLPYYSHLRQVTAVPD